MNGAAFLRRIRRLGRKRGVSVVWDTARGKGSHGTLDYGGRRCVVKDTKKELRPGLLAAMLTQLGLTKGDLEK